MKQPVALRRWADWGKLENDKYIPVTRSDEMDTWKKWEKYRLHGFLPVSVQEIRHMPNGIITPLRMMLSSL